MPSQEHLGRGHRAHVPTAAYKAHGCLAEEVNETKKRIEARRLGRAIRDSESSPKYTDDKDEGAEPPVLKSSPFAEKDELANELDANEAQRQHLIKTLSARDNRNDLANMDLEDLERICDDGGKPTKTAKGDAGNMFDYSAQVKDKGPARPAIPATTAASSRAGSNMAPNKKKRSRSPPPDQGKKHIRDSDSTYRRVSYNRNAHSPPRRPRNTGESRSFVAHTASGSGHRHGHRLSHSPPDKRSRAGTKSSSQPDSRSSRQGHARSESCSRSDSNTRSSPHHSRGSSRARSEQSDSSRNEDGSERDYSWDDKEGGESKRYDRGKAGNFTGVEREMLDNTYETVCAHLCAKVPFPEVKRYANIMFKAWEMSLSNADLRLQQYPFTQRHAQAICGRINSFRGRLREEVRTIFKNLFPFHKGKLSAEEIKAKVDKSLPSEFHRLPSAPPKTGWFGHKWVQEAISNTIFTGRNPIGVKFPEYFNPMPPKFVALLCGLMAHLLKEWSTGEPIQALQSNELSRRRKSKSGRPVKPPQPRMNYYDAEPTFKDQYDFIRRFEENQPDRYPVLMLLLYKDSMKDVGANPIPSDEEIEHSTRAYNDSDMFAVDIPTAEELARVDAWAGGALRKQAHATRPPRAAVTNVAAGDDEDRCGDEAASGEPGGQEQHDLYHGYEDENQHNDNPKVHDEEDLDTGIGFEFLQRNATDPLPTKSARSQGNSYTFVQRPVHTANVRCTKDASKSPSGSRASQSSGAQALAKHAFPTPESEQDYNRQTVVCPIAQSHSHSRLEVLMPKRISDEEERTIPMRMPKRQVTPPRKSIGPKAALASGRKPVPRKFVVPKARHLE